MNTNKDIPGVPVPQWFRNEYQKLPKIACARKHLPYPSQGLLWGSREPRSVRVSYKLYSTLQIIFYLMHRELLLSFPFVPDPLFLWHVPPSMLARTRRKGTGSVSPVQPQRVKADTKYTPAECNTGVRMHQPTTATRRSPAAVLQLETRHPPQRGHQERDLLLPSSKTETLTLISSTSCILSVESRKSEQSHDRNNDKRLVYKTRDNENSLFPINGDRVVS